nr:MAG TPA: hypothetical protein [Caudoviricetes sp.]
MTVDDDHPVRFRFHRSVTNSRSFYPFFLFLSFIHRFPQVARHIAQIFLAESVEVLYS